MSSNLDLSRQLEKHDQIEQLVHQIVERCAELYGTNYEHIAKKILAKDDIEIISDGRLLDLMSELYALENSEDESANPYIQLVNMYNP